MNRRSLLFALLAATVAAQVPPPRFKVALGLSARVLGRANRTDVTAAMKAWLPGSFKERKVNAEPAVEVFDSLDDIVQAMRQEKIDLATVGMDDFLVLEKKVPLAGLFSSQVKNRITEQFVLLVRRDRAFKGLADLRGQSMVVLEGNRALLAPTWLDTELLRRHLPVSVRHCARVAFAAKPALAIMPVFFGQADAALVYRSGFETASELNPQLGRELTVLAASPEYLSCVGAYRADAPAASADFYRQEVAHLPDTPGGRLMLNLFQSDALVEVKESDLRETRALLAEHARLLAGAQGKDGPP